MSALVPRIEVASPSSGRRTGLRRRRRLEVTLRLKAALAMLLAVCAAHGQESSPRVLALKAGEYLWMPELAPKGPVAIVISLPEQLAYVYRNGVRIGVSTISSGKPGYETPTGVFTILQKHREHYSNLYDNAPMPYMQRLTWDGVALHAGRVPGYPASHGCVRLPYAFSEKLFGITAQGMTVVIADTDAQAPQVASPGLFVPVDPATGTPRPASAVPPESDYVWAPERSPSGPLTIVLSTHDGEAVVLRDAIEIGRARLTLAGASVQGTHAYVLLEGTGSGVSTVLPERPALRWLALAAPNPGKSRGPSLQQAFAEGLIKVPPDFAGRVYDQLVPGTTVVVTDEPMHGRETPPGMTVLRADESTSTED
ncbi:MAG: L,D-transpeptidase [Lysobacteraceae bacterium]|nr:MAG: L,D-transpeptidase [Xanthomonadaceae bacterium]